jgi:hypothetical protein
MKPIKPTNALVETNKTSCHRLLFGFDAAKKVVVAFSMFFKRN